ncbi:MAG: MerR family transcriptional regulator [Firmicutes bacterium HGW-Firmicutes-7]|nr:MAG: MerR family transcriptional regulator [Firmicutes bacterium HGW-Firmicutes-7]
MDYAISHLCKRFNLSRSTILYYDTIGLLKPSSRGTNNYRKYSDEDVKKLEEICKYRQIGIPLEDIKGLLAASEGIIKKTLEERLDELNIQISRIRNQYHLIINILKNEDLLKRLQIVEKDTLVQILTLAGLNEGDMDMLHAKVEKMSPEGHQIFLEALGIENEEIIEIREYARRLMKNSTGIT